MLAVSYLLVLISISKIKSQNNARSLISAGADINIKDNMGYTALMHAIRLHNKGVTMELVHARADIHIKDDMGFTALKEQLWYSFEFIKN